jgi:iron complex transport system permease protein
MTACVVSFIGVIGFIGLVAPHIVRLLVGEDYRLLIPGSALAGAFLLVLSDTIARSVFIPLELPIGVVTSIIGVPFFVSILMHRRRGF